MGVLRCVIAAVLLMAAFPVAAMSQEKDIAGSKDHPLFTRMPNFYISEYKESEYEKTDFYDNDKQKLVPVEGHSFHITYKLKQGAKRPADDAIKDNYVNAIKKIGGSGYRINASHVEMKLSKKGGEIWADVGADSSGYSLLVVEKGNV